MIDDNKDNKIEEAAYKFATSQTHGELLALIDGYKEGYKDAINELLKDLLHPASEVPRNDNGKILAFSKEIGYRKLYDMNAMLDETDCYTYQDMWENEVNKYRLSDWIFVEELFNLIIKGGKQ
jgi:hypothetical protein|nr:MAG TPA: hypothetical protein [Caudoviricetes sp.]